MKRTLFLPMFLLTALAAAHSTRAQGGFLYIASSAAGGPPPMSRRHRKLKGWQRPTGRRGSTRRRADA